MSNENEVSVLIKLKSNNAGTPEYEAMVREFEAEDAKLEGTIKIPKNNHLVTEEGHLLTIRPERLDFAQANEPDEFVILTEV